MMAGCIVHKPNRIYAVPGHGQMVGADHIAYRNPGARSLGVASGCVPGRSSRGSER
jgi:hypothetical protein